MSSPQSHKVQYSATLIGCGKMGSAMLRSWLDNNLVNRVDIIKPSPLADEFQNNKLIHYHSVFQNDEITSDILVLATKPQTLKEASQNIANNISDKTVILSIAAGQSLSSLDRILGSEKPIIRAMPNLPASIGKGISVAIANRHVSTEQKNMVNDLLAASGQNRWVENETLMDAVTAISATGTAYIFYLIETITKSAEILGLDTETAIELARQTVIGAAALAEHESSASAKTLRENVTSSGGTTEAALNILMDGRFQELMDESFTAAKKRSEELNQ